MPNVYSYFDEIRCITLDTTESRRKHTEHWFKKLSIPAKFFVAKKHPKGGIYGCFDSHIKILIDAYNRGLDNVLVFEDDVMATDSYSEELVQKAIDFMKSNDDWDIFYFGYGDSNPFNLSSVLSSSYVSENIVQFNPLQAGSLCYSKKAIQKIIKSYHEYIGKMHYDIYISSYIGLKNYCLVPMVFQQNFYLEYNIEGANVVESIGRKLYPLIAFIKQNYNFSVIKYFFNIIYAKYKQNKIYTLILAIIIYLLLLCLIFASLNI